MANLPKVKLKDIDFDRMSKEGLYKSATQYVPLKNKILEMIDKEEKGKRGDAGYEDDSGKHKKTLKYGLTEQAVQQTVFENATLFGLGQKYNDAGLQKTYAFELGSEIFNYLYNDKNYKKISKDNYKAEGKTLQMLNTLAILNAGRQVSVWNEATSDNDISCGFYFSYLDEDTQADILVATWTEDSSPKKRATYLMTESIKNGDINKIANSLISHKDKKNGFALDAIDNKLQGIFKRKLTAAINIYNRANPDDKIVYNEGDSLEKNAKLLQEKSQSKFINSDSSIVLASDTKSKKYQEQLVQPVSYDVEGIKRPLPEVSTPEQQKTQPNANMAQQTQSTQQVANKQKQDKPIYQRFGDYFLQAFDNFAKGYQSLISNLFTGNEQNEQQTNKNINLQ